MVLARRRCGAIGVVLLLALAGCSSGGDSTPSATSAAESSTPRDSEATAPTDSGTPGSASVPPDVSGTAAHDEVTPGTSASPAPGSCPTVNPVRVTRADTAPRRATEVVTVVSDGTNLTSGTREQNDFLTPSLTAPDGATANDPAAFEKIAKLLAGQKHRVLLVRPDPPDATASSTKKPFSAPGTYVVYNASSQLTAAVSAQCAGTEGLLTFISEADPSSGQINCAIEPSKNSSLARLLYQNNC